MTNRLELALNLPDALAGLPSDVATAIEDRLKRIQELLAAGAGKRGQVNFASNVAVENKRVMSLADAVADADLITYAQLKAALQCENLADILRECWEHPEAMEDELDPAVLTTNPGADYIFAYSVEVYATQNFNVLLSANNKIGLFEWCLPFDCTVKRLVCRTENCPVAGSFSLGLYDANLALVVSTGKLTLASLTTFNVTLSSAVTLKAGTYWLALTATTNAFNIYDIVQDTVQQAVLLMNKTRIGEAANSSSGGILPSTVSTPFTARVSINVPALLMESA